MKTLMVSPSGSDTTGNGTSEKPFATIRRALLSIPPHWIGGVTVQLAEGTYYDDSLAASGGAIVVPWHIRPARLTIRGAQNDVTKTIVQNPIRCEDACCGTLFVRDLTMDAYTHVPEFNVGGIYVVRCGVLDIYNIKVICGEVGITKVGVAVGSGTTAVIAGSTFTQCTNAVQAGAGGYVVSQNNTGNNYAYGLASYSGIIVKTGTQPAGNAGAEYKGDGGQIFA